jgi:hypothetical protein
MSTFSDEAKNQVSAGRNTVDRSLEDIKDFDMSDIPPGAFVAAGVVAGLVGVGIVGWMLYRIRRRRSLVQRLQDALPDSVRELPQGVRSRVRRAL